MSRNGDYRYQLDRWWGRGERLLWIMLNPSTADEQTDDATICQVRHYTMTHGYDGFTVANLFAFRSTDPRQLRCSHDAVGPLNDEILDQVVDNAGNVVVAWGSHAKGRALDVAARLSPCDLQCLGTTKDGHPRHPLYMKLDTRLRPWEVL